jgi:phage-related minor tail protein
MTDLADLRLRIDSRPVQDANTQLDRFVEHGEAAERVSTRIERSGSAAGRGFRRMGQDAQEAGRRVDWTSGAMSNLSFQLNDILSGLAMGQSPFQILTQQGGQVFQVFQMQPGLFSNLAKSVAAWAFSAKGATAGVAAGFVGLGLSLQSYASQQQDLERSLNGIGRASGVSVQGINDIAKSAASTFGLSVREARAFAAELATTGKIGQRSIDPLLSTITMMVQRLGYDGADAAKLLGDSIKSPTAGFDKLNDVIGIGNDRMRESIRLQEDSGRRSQAQAAVIDATNAALANMTRTQSFFTVVATGAGNLVSNAWDKLGQKMSDLTSVGRTLESEIELQKKRMQESVPWANLLGERYEKMVSDQALRKLDEFEQKLIRVRGEQEKAALDRTSIAVGNAVRTSLPEEAMRKQIQAEIDLIEKERQRLQQNGLLANSEAEVSQALDRKRDALNGVRSASETAIISDRAAIAALGARSPGELAAAAAIRTRIQLGGQANTVFAEQAKNDQVAAAAALARGQAERQLIDSARDRALAIKDAAGQAEVDLAVIGKSVGETERLRSNWQLYADLRREAERNNLKFDEAQYARLSRENDLIARRRQLIAESQAASDLAFERSQLGRSDTEQATAARLRAIYGDDYGSQMNGYIANQVRFNETLRQGKAMAVDFSTSLYRDTISGLQQGQKGWDAFLQAGINALTQLGNKLTELALSKSVTSLVSGLGSVFGGGGAGISTYSGIGNPWMPGGMVASLNGNVFQGGRIIPHSLGGVIDRPVAFPMAGGNIGTAVENGKPEAIMPLTRGPGGRLGVEMHGGSSEVNLKIELVDENGQHVPAKPAGTRQEGGVNFARFVVDANARDVAGGGPLAAILERTYGLRRVV